jgi:hypothetical protein
MHSKTCPNPRRTVRTLACCAGLFLFTAAAISAAIAQPSPTPFRKAQAAVDRACRAFTSYDRDRDGHNEIETLARIRERGRYPYEASGRSRGTVLVFVEKRLWEPWKEEKRPDAPSLDLKPSLQTFVRDLAREGYHALLLVCSLYAGPMHQDGLTVLALRDVLQTLRRDVPDLKGVNLVGNFPNAFLVRQYYWQRGDSLVLHAGAKVERRWDAVPHVRSIAEPVASPFDLVLADLDGHWETLYRRGPERLAGLYAAFPDDPAREVTDLFQYSAERYEDFFLVQDGTWEEEYLPQNKRRFTFKGEPNRECTEEDRKQVNILARPEIAIGRINATHAGIEPNSAIRGFHGEGLLNAEGRPQAVEFPDEKSVPRVTDLWIPSERLERRLLIEYFARNHRYRTGGYKDGRFPASFSTEWGSSMPEMKAAIPAWKDAPTNGTECAGAKLTVTDFVNWMKQPALARAIKAHSNAICSEFGAPPDLAAYEQSVGPQKWYWTREGARLVPGLKGGGGQAHFGLLRSLYENRVLPDAPVFYFHTGCESVTPWHYEREPYNSPKYGLWQIAEAFLMYGQGLALIGRGKVFYDEPREFWKVFGAGGNWGDGWRHYFDVEGADAELAKDGIGRKRAYFWSILGDLTLTLPEDLRQTTVSRK